MEESGRRSRWFNATLVVAIIAGLLAAAALIIVLTRSPQPSAGRTDPVPANISAPADAVTPVVVAPTSPVVTVTETRTRTVVPLPPAPSPSPTTHAPQGTVTETFENDIGASDRCARLLLTVHNRSDTAVLNVTVSFRTEYSGYPHPDSELKTAIVSTATPPQTVAVGVAPYADGTIVMEPCVVPPFTVDEPYRASTDAIPVSFTWRWAT